MADHVIHVSEDEAVRDFATLLARVRAGAEVVVENTDGAVAIVHAPAAPRRTLSESLALLPEHSSAVIDEDFAGDVKAAVEAMREPLSPPTWD